MALPSPNLDDRRFQQLVDEAKRYVQQRSPEWTDHNVSDPGVTLIETFAYMVDQLLYRLNRVPDRNYSAFLDLLGVQLFPPTVARADVDFWLSAPQPDTVRLPAGTEVATARGETEEAVVFSTTEDLAIVPSSLIRLVTAPASGDQTDRTAPLGAGKDIPCFQSRPEPGDALLFGLPTAVPRCIVAVRLDSRVEGVGVDPRQPPLVWEAWDGARWVLCETGTDSTGGLNRPGEITVFVPAGHTASVTAGIRAGWLRCRVTAPEPGQPFYSESPTIREAEVFTVGGTTGVEHAETVLDVPLGVSEGVAGQTYSVRRVPLLLDGEPPVVQVSSADGWQVWTPVEHFGASSPDDRHVQIDAVTGRFAFPPEVREADGTMRGYGAVPPKGAQLRVARYRTGGGAAGNVARGAIRVLRSSVPYVAGVANREAARGGVDGESVENAKARAPHILRVQERAVTAEDYEVIAREAARSLRRVRCLPAVAGEGGAVRVLVVPDAVPDEGGRLRFEQLIPPDSVLAAVSGRLDERRLVGTRLIVEPPAYVGVTVVAELVADAVDADRVRAEALDALFRHIDPLRGGTDGTGWPFGRPVQYGEIFAVLQAVPGVRLVDEVRLFPADPLTGRRGGAADRIDVAANALVFSHQHQVVVTAAGPGGRS
ncbi:putative baseplate assembly protein [Streptomyces poriferorum]|uniref:Baseplate assembly protein n=1 Tax=Streptomyces poriferorum TaxID=2798799 RepID=A0ABY9IPG2_9ACTN|nr:MULTISPECIES: putative baseplate assembly protein [Streptomyces]MBW5254062.1 putative baseplate assembly protein [Streptomyces poriferorum]MBW5261914.1 putative baseplate assembly protein [Streptomyces poriferorum]MDP5313897.1 putative baseplate assembly protein [Streptomyces sp. Alt4]WLQ50177.1 putative baseplate assembly protein [Streptomyces sp. Alt1]WLQ57156.1 putative baseplate assembly protein [Streptomyces sp. Alt2]